MTPAVSRNPQEGKGKMTFRCADLGAKDCDWQTSGNSEEDILSKVEQHAREKHSMTMDNETRGKVRSAIRRQAA